MDNSTWNIMRLRAGDTPRKKTAMYGNAKASEDMLATYWTFALWNDEHKIIVDCGVNEEDETPWYNAPANNVPANEKLPAQLSFLGWEPDDVDTVIFTHLHYDHTGYAYLFKRAKFFVQRAEYDAAMNRPQEGYFAFYKRSNYDKTAIRYSAWCFLDGETEIYPGIIAVPTPGHSIGHQSLLIDTSEGAVCITGDAVNVKYAIDHNVTNGLPIYDGLAQLNSYKKIRQIADRIITAHDEVSPDVYDHQTSGFPIL